MGQNEENQQSVTKIQSVMAVIRMHDHKLIASRQPKHFTRIFDAFLGRFEIWGIFESKFWTRSLLKPNQFLDTCVILWILIKHAS